MPRCRTIPAVSVVIPTRNRPALLARAIESAINQTRPASEVIVVIDGEDDQASASLTNSFGKQVQVVALERPVGGAEARNVGVRHARGEWIAFLDDDDEWLPNKLELQMAVAGETEEHCGIIACKVLAKCGNRVDVWPIKPPIKPYSEYLLVRRRLRYGEGLLQTSTLVARRELLRRVPFREGLQKHQDWDWILRATHVDRAEVAFVNEPLAIWHLDDNRARVSRLENWQGSLDWIRSAKQLVTKKAYAAFLANNVTRQAAAARAWRFAPALFVEMVREGQPSARDLFVFAMSWIVPMTFIQRLRSLLIQHSVTDGRFMEEA